MFFPALWPKELIFHYHRINKSSRKMIIEKVDETPSREDTLKRFLITMHSFLEQIETYKERPEFAHFILQGLFYEGKYGKVLTACANFHQHAGILLLKVQTLITTRQFEEVPELLARIKELTREKEPVLYLSAYAFDVLYSYYSQSFNDLPLKIAELERVFEQEREKAAGNPLVQNLLRQEYINGLSVNIALNRRNGNLVQGSEIGKKLITQARELNNRFLMNRLLNNTALCLIEIGHLKEGLSFLEEAFEFSIILANEIRIASFANNIGFIYRQLGYLDHALRYFKIALEYA